MVTLAATPNSGYIFLGWSGDAACSTGVVRLTADTTCIAAFEGGPTGQSVLQINQQGSGSGTVTSSPLGINCGSICSASFTQNGVVTLTASPAAGSAFEGWTGDPDCSDGRVTMDTGKTCTAFFQLQ